MGASTGGVVTELVDGLKGPMVQQGRYAVDDDDALSAEIKALPEAMSHTFGILQHLVDDLALAGVDVSYFPNNAERVLIRYAKELTK